MRVPLGSKSVLLQDWSALVSAAAERLLDENTHCELKKALPPSSQNLEIARDLASLTVLGGLLVVGIKDAGGNRAGEVLGIPDTAATQTRLIQIADGLVEPSVVCTVSTVSNPESPDRGCVLVVVPPSPTAPHRADERYWGRTSEGKRVLPDAEIATLFAQRRQRVDTLSHELNGLGAFDPVPSVAREGGHLYLIARPLQPIAEGDPPWGDQHPLAIMANADFADANYGGPDLTSFRQSAPHPHGVIAEEPYDPTRYARNAERYSGRLLIRDNGGLDLVFGGATMTEDMGQFTGVYLDWPALAVHVEQAVQLAGWLGEALGYHGSWAWALRADRLLNTKSISAYGRVRLREAPGYPEETYSSQTAATADEMSQHPQHVVSRLLRSLARGLGEGRHFPYTELSDLMRGR